jgi:hypothetical protein
MRNAECVIKDFDFKIVHLVLSHLSLISHLSLKKTKNPKLKIIPNKKKPTTDYLTSSRFFILQASQQFAIEQNRRSLSTNFINAREGSHDRPILFCGNR